MCAKKIHLPKLVESLNYFCVLQFSTHTCLLFRFKKKYLQVALKINVKNLTCECRVIHNALSLFSNYLALRVHNNSQANLKPIYKK